MRNVFLVLLVVLLAASAASAETEFEPFVGFGASNGLGFDGAEAGVGMRLLQESGRFRFALGASASNAQKSFAEGGYTFGGSVTGSYFVSRRFRLGGGISVSGWKNEQYRKTGVRPTVHVGGPRWALTYSLPDDTENSTSALSIGARMPSIGRLVVTPSITAVRFFRTADESWQYGTSFGLTFGWSVGGLNYARR